MPKVDNFTFSQIQYQPSKIAKGFYHFQIYKHFILSFYIDLAYFYYFQIYKHFILSFYIDLAYFYYFQIYKHFILSFYIDSAYLGS